MDASCQPHFRFYPGVYRDAGAMEETEAPCDACRLPCGWPYTGTIYAVAELDNLCAQCIADGRTGSALNDPHFSFHDTELECVSHEPARELLQRTPGRRLFQSVRVARAGSHAACLYRP